MNRSRPEDSALSVEIISAVADRRPDLDCPHGTRGAEALDRRAGETERLLNLLGGVPAVGIERRARGHAASPPSQSTWRAWRMIDPDALSWMVNPSDETASLAI